MKVPGLSRFFTAMYHLMVSLSQVLVTGSGLISILSWASISSQSSGVNRLFFTPANWGDGRSSNSGLSPVTLTAWPKALPSESAATMAEKVRAKRFAERSVHAVWV